jgi:hypothetical protein
MNCCAEFSLTSCHFTRGIRSTGTHIIAWREDFVLPGLTRNSAETSIACFARLNTGFGRYDRFIVTRQINSQ